MARLERTPYPLPGGGVSQEATAAMWALMEKSNTLVRGEVVGGVLQFPRADGYATYLVTKEKPLTVQHIPYMDAWTVEPALIRGLTKADVLEMLGWRASLSRLFAERT